MALTAFPKANHGPSPHPTHLVAALGWPGAQGSGRWWLLCLAGDALSWLVLTEQTQPLAYVSPTSKQSHPHKSDRRVASIEFQATQSCMGRSRPSDAHSKLGCCTNHLPHPALTCAGEHFMGVCQQMHVIRAARSAQVVAQGPNACVMRARMCRGADRGVVCRWQWPKRYQLGATHHPGGFSRRRGGAQLQPTRWTTRSWSCYDAGDCALLVRCYYHRTADDREGLTFVRWRARAGEKLPGYYILFGALRATQS